MYMIYEYRNDLKIPILWKSPCLSVFSCRYHLRFLSPWNTFGASLPGIIASNLGPATRAGSYSVFIIEFSRYNAWSNFRHIHIISSKKKQNSKKTSSNAQKRSKKGVFKDKSPFSIYLEFHKSHHYEFPRLRGFPKDAIVSHRAKARLLLNLLWSSDMDLLNMIF